MELTIPGAILSCGVDIEVLPEISAKYAIAETEMTPEEARQMISITGGTVTSQPQFEYPGGNSSQGFPREPGPFIQSRLPETIPSFKIGKYEVTRELWYEVYTWSKTNGYSFGSYSWTAPSGDQNFLPIQMVSCKEAVIWCNAYSEKTGLTPVYYKDAGKTAVLRDTSASQYANISLMEDADGYRIPTPALWEYAARGGDVDGPQWNYRWPGTDTFSAVKQYAWADQIRTYDVYNNEIPVGILLPNAAGIHDMGGNIHEWTVKTDDRDPSQTVTRGGANNRDASRSAFDAAREERRWDSSRDIIGFRVISHVE
jgi:formylglycine-generating enzyme required for sulfatase activity